MSVVSVTDWVSFREFCGKLLFQHACADPHICSCADLLCNVDWEGPELFNVSTCAPHGMWEEYVAEHEENGLQLTTWLLDAGLDFLQDWLLDMQEDPDRNSSKRIRRCIRSCERHLNEVWQGK